MFKHVFLAIILLFSTFLFGAGEYDKDIVVKNQTRNDKVKTVFREMMDAYEEEDISQFFSYVSEDRFQQDYMTFFDAIDEDIRVYDILSVDTWVNKITEDGVKRFLYVQWDKRYLATSSDTEINQRGYSRFLFDEVNGKYKLIELAGNNFWGQSLPEWTEEVGDIAGQEVYTDASGNPSVNPPAGLPDLTVTINSASVSEVLFSINNIGATTASSPIHYQIDFCGLPSQSYTYTSDIAAGDDSGEISQVLGMCYSSAIIVITIDPDGLIAEEDDQNNQDSY